MISSTHRRQTETTNMIAKGREGGKIIKKEKNRYRNHETTQDCNIPIRTHNVTFSAGRIVNNIAYTHFHFITPFLRWDDDEVKGSLICVRNSLKWEKTTPQQFTHVGILIKMCGNWNCCGPNSIMHALLVERWKRK